MINKRTIRSAIVCLGLSYAVVGLGFPVHSTTVTLMNDIDASQTTFLASGVRAHHGRDGRGHFNRDLQGVLHKRYRWAPRAMRFSMVFSRAPVPFSNQCPLFDFCGPGHVDAFSESRFECLSNFTDVDDPVEIRFHLDKAGILKCEREVQWLPKW